MLRSGATRKSGSLMAKLHLITYGCQMNEYDSERVAGLLRAHVTVMEGCEKHCTFCVVPTTRGRERSHAPEAILDEIRGLVAEGCREVTLLGQTVNAYGRDLTPPTDLAALFERVAAVDGLARIRFITSNPYNLTSRLIGALRDVPKVCEYFHLPLQS